jgi:steroid 5-alpha reductase family enzyme
MFEALALNAAVLIALVLIQWLISVKINDVSFVDAFWGAGMGVMALTSWVQLDQPGLLATLILVMTAAWGFRLGIHLFVRWWAEGEDKRYTSILEKDREKGNFAVAALTKVWLSQAALLFMVSSPAQVGILASENPVTSPVTAPVMLLAYAGVAIYLVGIFFEWVGDWQLQRFKSNADNSGKVLDTGLWRYTRHPNYFGDFMAWWGIWLVCASVGWVYAAATVIGPIFLSFTLTKWSGAALLEKGMATTKGDKYDDYKRRTSAFFPRPPKDRSKDTARR